MNYRADIDGLRAVAVLMVVFYHAFPDFISGGYIGVDVFFVISGYIITLKLLESIESKKFSIFDFYLKRIRRIYPVLLLVVSITVCAGYFILYPDELRLLYKYAASSNLFVTNLVAMRDAGYFDVNAYYKPLLHIWSLGVEEQFYIVFPLIMITLVGLNVLSKGLLFLLVFSLGVSILYTDQLSGQAYFNPLYRFWELLSGVMLALYEKGYFMSRLKRFPLVNMPAKESLSLIGMLMIIAPSFVLSSSSVFPGYLAIIPVVGTLFIIANGSVTYVGRFLLSHKILVGVGLMSYSLYLWHWPFISFAYILTDGKPSFSQTFSVIVISFLVSFLTYRYIESRTKLLNNKNYLVSLFFLVTLLGAGFLYIYKSKIGLDFERKNIVMQGSTGHEFYNQFKVNHKNLCGQGVGFRHECFPGAQDEILIAVIGDSHADHLGLALASVDKNNKVVVFDIEGLPVKENHRTSILIDKIAEDRRIKFVIFSSYWAGRVSDVDSMKNYFGDFNYFASILKSSGKSVSFFGGVPDFDFVPESCKYQSKLLRNAKCEQKINLQNSKYLKFASNLREFTKDKGIFYFDGFNIFCKEASCRMGFNQKLYYRDENHLNENGVIILGEYSKNYFRK